MNAVKDLKEYHDKYPIGNPPGYTFQPDPLTKLFRATCLYQNKKTFGVGSSKKDAQRTAADEMLKSLNIIPKIPVLGFTRVPSLKAVTPCPSSTAARVIKKELTEDEKLKAYRFLAEYGDKDASWDPMKWMAPEQRIIDLADLGLKSEDVPKSDTLACRLQNADAIDTFKQIMKEMKLKFCCKVPEIKHDAKVSEIKHDKPMHIVLIHIYYRIPLMAGGTAISVELAAYAACEKAITMLEVYTN